MLPQFLEAWMRTENFWALNFVHWCNRGFFQRCLSFCFSQKSKRTNFKEERTSPNEPTAAAATTTTATTAATTATTTAAATATTTTAAAASRVGWVWFLSNSRIRFYCQNKWVIDITLNIKDSLLCLILWWLLWNFFLFTEMLILGKARLPIKWVSTRFELSGKFINWLDSKFYEY